MNLVHKLKRAAKEWDNKATGYAASTSSKYLEACDMRDLLEDAYRKIEQLEKPIYVVPDTPLSNIDRARLDMY
jgi:hypothetical protein